MKRLFLLMLIILIGHSRKITTTQFNDGKSYTIFESFEKAGFLSHQNNNLFPQKSSPLISFSKLDKI